MTGQAGDPRDHRGGERTFLDTFRREADDRLEEIVSALTAASEGRARPEEAAAVFRNVHNLKGAAAMLELDEVRRLAHAMEQALEHAGDSIPPALADRLLEAAAALRTQVAREGRPAAELSPDFEQAPPH